MTAGCSAILFRHKVFVAAFVDAGGVEADLLNHTINGRVIGIVNLDRCTGQHSAVASSR